jgi:ketosteroid isomerase-like protein
MTHPYRPMLIAGSLLLLASGTAAAQGTAIPGTDGYNDYPRGREAYVKEVQQEVRVTLARLLDAMDRGDVDAATRLYTRDGVLVYPDGDAARSQAEIRARLAADIRRMPRFRIQESDVEASGDMAFISGMYVYDDTSGGGAPVARLGNVTLVMWRTWERQWRIRFMVLGGPLQPKS